MDKLSDDALEKWRRAGRITAKARDLAASLIAPGARLEEVAEKVEGFIRSEGARPAFPLNLSCDHWAAHYTPTIDDPMAFLEGQIVKVDIGAEIDGYPADSAVTVEVGKARRHGELARASREALDVGVEMMGPNLQLQKVGDAIEPFATNGEGQVENAQAGNIYRFQGPKRVKDADARALQEALQREHPSLPFAARWTRGLCKDPKKALKALHAAGVVYAYPVLVEKGWGAVSQHEHSVLITEDGAERLT